ncbi:MAG: hypothetical protein PHS54_03815 [Clostridia bacterium]|nr:hypothetical protein [Clostridia bacterium]
MKSKIYYFVVILLFASFLACVFPFPLHKTGYESLSKKEQALYNDAYELEQNYHNDLNNYNEVKEEIPEVVNLNWFDVVNTLFTKYTLIAEVIDVNTKKSYLVKRVGGYNHVDVQPINATNTAIMKSIYGGVWSWVRRPVWVNINGSYVAASINGMPHGFTLIDGNNMDGHTCIHFLMSRTHGTNRVDEAHQAAVAEAYARRNELYQYLANN